jgi:hypothetical protein
VSFDNRTIKDAKGARFYTLSHKLDPSKSADAHAATSTIVHVVVCVATATARAAAAE